jgi:cytochrome c biogenesis protein ResB
MPIYISLYRNKKHLQDIKFKLIDIPVKNGINKLHPLFFSKYKNIDFIFAGIKRYYYSGFQIAKNSYTWVVWMGCILMIISLFLSFYFNHKSMWIKISKSENKKENSIEIIFTSHKKLESIYKSIEKKIDEFKKSI